MALQHVHSKNPFKRMICDQIREAADLPPGQGRVTLVKYNAETQIAQGVVHYRPDGRRPKRYHIQVEWPKPGPPPTTYMLICEAFEAANEKQHICVRMSLMEIVLGELEKRGLGIFREKRGD